MCGCRVWQAAAEELGTVMVFTMVQAAKDWLDEFFNEEEEVDGPAEEKAILPQELVRAPPA